MIIATCSSSSSMFVRVRDTHQLYTSGVKLVYLGKQGISEASAFLLYCPGKLGGPHLHQTVTNDLAEYN
jgi:hypothetical protein